MQVALVSGKFERTDVVLGVSDEQEITQWRFQALKSRFMIQSSVYLSESMPWLVQA
jgi:hypothetical protein